MVSLNSYNLMQQYITYIIICFYNVGDLDCFEAFLFRRNKADGPHTQAYPLLAPRPQAPPVPGFPVGRPWLAPLEPLLALSPAIL
jgi:hypothetical protein